jgi:Fur family ferric uptake transcriptional regulator
MKNDQLRKELKERNLRMTPQRDLILRTFEGEEEHLCVEEVYRKVLDRRHRISRATVYRTVELLVEIGLLHKIVFKDGIVRYEPVKRGTHHHHHVVCSKCGRVVELPLDYLEELEDLVKNRTGYTIEDHQLKFYGLCPQCQRENRSPDSTSNAII